MCYWLEFSFKNKHDLFFSKLMFRKFTTSSSVDGEGYTWIDEVTQRWTIAHVVTETYIFMWQAFSYASTHEAQFENLL